MRGRERKEEREEILSVYLSLNVSFAMFVINNQSCLQFYFPMLARFSRSRKCSSTKLRYSGTAKVPLKKLQLKLTSSR